MRAVIPQAVELIRQTEGRSGQTVNGMWLPYHVAADPAKVLTIYRGHKIVLPFDDWMLTGVTEAQGESIFAQDVANHCRHIQRDVGVGITLSDWVYGAFASFCFNLGADILSTGNNGKETTILLLLRTNRITSALLGMHKFSNSGGIYRDGLFYRRLVEIYLGLTGKLVTKPSVCVAAIKLIEDIKAVPAVQGNYPVDILAYFNAHHVKKLCGHCTVRN